MTPAARAEALARELVDGDRFPEPGQPWRRTVAIGDPQGRASKFFAVLEARGLLGDDGRLGADVQLVSIGDHFDFGTRAEGTLDDAQVDGPRVLRWLCAHAPAQVAILCGNHDLARVDELALIDDAQFAAAAQVADELGQRHHHQPTIDRAAALREYAARCPGLPGPGLVHRDLSAFTVAQRAAVQHALVTGRMRLAATARLPSARPLLLTHAGVTTRELGFLGAVDPSSPAAVRDALAAHLAGAVAAVAPTWQGGGRARLRLEPLHVGAATELVEDALPEGGGMLYHRPADPDRPGADRRWEREQARPRRYHPRTLPRGLAQVAGHTGHPKCVVELTRWCDPPMPESLSGRRTLGVDADGTIRYQLGIHDLAPTSAALYLIDPSLHRAPDPTAVEVLELAPGSLTTDGPT